MAVLPICPRAFFKCMFYHHSFKWLEMMQGRGKLDLKHIVMSSLTDIKGWSVLKNSVETLILLLKSPLKLSDCQSKLGKKMSIRKFLIFVDIGILKKCGWDGKNLQNRFGPVQTCNTVIHICTAQGRWTMPEAGRQSQTLLSFCTEDSVPSSFWQASLWYHEESLVWL